jgi:hypothetical protein
MMDERLLLAAGAALALLLVIAWAAATLQTRRRNQMLAAGFDSSTRSRLVYASSPSAGGFDAHFEPPPEPFVHLELRYRGGATVDPIGLLLRMFSGRNDELMFRGLLPERPAAELVWARGRIPERAMARRARASLWVQRRSDLIDSEYAVRGVDATALEYVFVDLQARFGALLQRVSVVADREDVHIEVVMRGGELQGSAAPALVATLRSLGRAAQRQ